MSLDAHLKNPQYTFDATSGTINFVSEDITTIEKTVSGKVVFFKGVQPILAIHEESDVALDYAEGYVYIITQGKFLYRFSFYGLTDMDGKSYTALNNTDFNSYQGKLREVYEDLNTLVLVGCCDCGGGGSSNVLFYNDFESFPAEGAVDFLYVDKATPSIYIWNGVDAYVMIAGSGGGVESVVAGDDIDIDDTDPANPIVGVTPHTFGRLSGTEVGYPYTGDLEMSGSIRNIFIGDLLTDYSRHYLEGGLAGIETKSSGTYARFYSQSGKNLFAESDFPTFKGIQCQSDEQYYEASSLISLSTLKKRFWTKAGIWDVNDDSVAGFIVGSLLWDTTNSKMYECTDNTAGAADWSEVFNGGSSSSKSYLGGRGVISMGSGNATYIPIYSLSGTNTNQANNLTNFDGRSMKLFENTTFLGISVNNSSAQPASGDLTITLVVNSVDSALVLTIPAGSASGDYTVTGSVAVSAGDNVAWKYSNGASSTSAIIQVCYAVITIP